VPQVQLVFATQAHFTAISDGQAQDSATPGDGISLAVTEVPHEENNGQYPNSLLINQADCADRAHDNRQVVSAVVRIEPAGTTSKAKSTIITSQANPMISINQANSRLIALPPELQLRVFDLLDRCSSTCLGLSTRVFYRLHRAARGRVPLCAFYFIPGGPDCSGFRLHVLLNEWAGPELLYHEIKDKFVTRTSKEIEEYERAMLPENPCTRWCCKGLNRDNADELAIIQQRDNMEKRKDAKEAGKLSYWWI
jgi:hypothetical protein